MKTNPLLKIIKKELNSLPPYYYSIEQTPFMCPLNIEKSEIHKGNFYVINCYYKPISKIIHFKTNNIIEK